MKPFSLSITSLVIMAFLVSSCNTEEEDPELVSKWKLIEMLADPGDGSGQFTPVSSDKLIEFFEDSTFVSNGNMCQMSQESNTTTSGTYSPTSSVISPSNCPSFPFPINFEMEGQHLIVNYPCIEPCREKYEQID